MICYSYTMKRKVLFVCILVIPIVLTIAAGSIKHQTRSAIDIEKGWPFVVSEYSTDGANGPIVRSQHYTENTALNYLFYLVVTLLVLTPALYTKRKAKKPKTKRLYHQ